MPGQISPGVYRYSWYMGRKASDGEWADSYIVWGGNGLGLTRVLEDDVLAEVDGEAIPYDAFGPFDPVALGYTTGRYLVNYDLAPGEYVLRPLNEGSAAHWALLDESFAVIEMHDSFESVVIEIKESDFALEYVGVIDHVRDKT